MSNLISENMSKLSGYNWLDILGIANILDKAYIKNNEGLEYFKNIENNQLIPFFIEDKEVNLNNNLIIYESTQTKAEITSFVYYNTLFFCLIGSDDLIDWIYDAQLFPENIILNNIQCKVHTGFLKQYNSLKSVIFEALNKYMTNRTQFKVVFICHSLGILGELAAIDIKNFNSTIIIDNISFGAPRVGNKDFCSVCNLTFRNNLRFVNNNDMIPSFQFFGGYVHNGTVIIFKENSELSYKDRTIWDDLKNVFLVIFSWIPFFKLTEATDHNLDNYIIKINKLIN
jgi:hypothetical protein